MTLWNLQENSQAIVGSLSARIPLTYQKRLIELGFHENEKVMCVKRTPAGNPRLFRVGDSVYSLEKEIADAIEVINVQML